ncbi:unnamed protein product, partial [Mesorhabditis belari]|uniref:Uncharacterized protein n=1 Tax=Mesorhabditis belari TaxID=2138241 RepID=A0AAF3FEY6_9BILA
MNKNFDADLEEMSNESDPPDFFGSIYTLERRMRGSPRLILSRTFPSDSSTPITPPTNFPQKCSCRYLWRKELHGLSQLMMVKSLSFPNLIFCPNSPDAVHVEDIVKDMETRLGGHLNGTYKDLLKYFIAGSGFDYVYIDQFSDEYKRNLQMNYEIWRGNRSTLDLFKFVFEENSITCNEFFQQCTQGSLNANCCDIFSPTFVMLRGRCFKLNGYNQNDADELAKLRLFIKNIPSPLVNDNHFQSNVIMFIGDENIETSTFPRYYLNPNSWNKFRFNSRLIISLSDNPRCSILPRNRGLYTCYVYEYIKESVVGKYNCTLPYYKETLDYVYSVPVCNVSTVIANYSDIKWPRLESVFHLALAEKFQSTGPRRRTIKLERNLMVTDLSLLSMSYKC